MVTTKQAAEHKDKERKEANANMKSIRIVSIFALGCLAAISLAQGGRGGMRMMGQNNSKLGLVQRADVQRDLGITADQKTKIATAQSEMDAKRQAAFEEMRNSGSFDREAMQKMMETMGKEGDKKVEGILTADQFKRLKEIQLQLTGNRAILDKEVQKALELTKEQLAKIDSLQQNMNAANEALMQQAMDGSLSREEVQPKMQKNMEAFNAELGKILTADQAAKLKTMGGKPFVADKPAGGGN